MENWITVESFGAECPTNWDEIADFLNEIIRERGIENDHEAVNELWEQYCNGDIAGAPEAVSNAQLWYAIMQDNDEQDWGTGSYDRDEAVERVRAMLDEYPDAYIAVIDESGSEPMCVEEIRDF